ncbi:MAG: polysaccharide deacetylase [Flaviaesturariibacter sp.]|nr:polysaccharide deacetylase [Flaviaesturariibacter sp.]
MAGLIFERMQRYFIKTPWLVKRIFSSYVWSLPATDKRLYLTFDDGPHPAITPWVLDELKKFDAKATFFCIGKNVCDHPQVFQQISTEGHSIGNHTFHHLNGWKTPAKEYMADVEAAAACLPTNLFRPPYGRIKRSQAAGIRSVFPNAKIIMWDVLSGDFDQSISPEQCLQNVLQKTVPGSIIVFHDSEKAYPHLAYALPKVLAAFAASGYSFKAINNV